MLLLVLSAVLAVVFLVAREPLALLLLVPLGLFALRLERMRVTATSDRLEIRNFWMTTELDRQQIRAFIVEDLMDPAARNQRQRTIYVYLHDGTSRRLSATKRDYFKFWSFTPSAGRKNQADDICDQLNAWLRVAGA